MLRPALRPEAPQPFRPLWRAARAASLIVLATLSLNPPLRAQAPADADAEARAIVERADRIRFPADGFQVDIAISSKAPDQGSPEARKYRVLSRGNENTIVMTVEPEADRGQIMLMRGRDLWLFMPSVSQPVRLSVAQRLTGEVANGDLARANFAGDYNPKLLRVDGSGADAQQVLELSAVDRSVTYAKVLLWVKQANGQPVRAEFYSVSNRLLKTCSYENYKQLGGALRPTRLVMEDALKKGEVSVLEYDDMKPRELPDRVFSKEYLRKLQ
ncbi:outer membrane lipoprotein-sorting protein [Uliginosibacterium sp. H1]|uniref:outer membrane lipoprotein-sorting protein n=1 Tax=Uliginosibacterium sp. H1 TaxID=3114757 RepID=UPI002E182DF0|nr:outer membrane lipoprotein-sorting protein [Uliginosibacterium sp. H1]